MSFGTIQASRRRGKPVNLFLFVYGPNPTDFYAYTDAETAITHNDIVYNPETIGRESIRSTGTLDKSKMTVAAATATEAAELFRVYPPSGVVNLIIREGHLTDPDEQFNVIWAGRVLSCAFEEGEASFTCEPVSTSMRRAMLRRNYQYGCPHVLYGPGCKAVKDLFKQTTAVSATANTTVTLPAGWEGPWPKEKFRGGLAEWTTVEGHREKRTILRVNPATDQIILSGLLRGLAVAADIDLYLGCNHQMTDCKDIFDNILNYGGCPWIPTKSPFGTTNNFY